MPSLASFEAVPISLYATETKSRVGKPVLISNPDLSQPSLYYTPRNKSNPNLTPPISTLDWSPLTPS
ncbi:hypothetical protein ACSBR1_015554 [Camellia fascicularis]